MHRIFGFEWIENNADNMHSMVVPASQEEDGQG